MPKNSPKCPPNQRMREKRAYILIISIRWFFSFFFCSLNGTPTNRLINGDGDGVCRFGECDKLGRHCAACARASLMWSHRPSDSVRATTSSHTPTRSSTNTSSVMATPSRDHKIRPTRVSAKDAPGNPRTLGNAR